MVWPPRYAAAAANPPRYPEPLDDRGEYNSEAVDSSTCLGKVQAGRFDPAPYAARWLEAAAYVWAPGTGPTYQELLQDAATAVLRFPPEIEGQGSQTLYLASAQWPDLGRLDELLGLFIYSRPAGSTAWRTAVSYRPFTEELALYSPLGINQPTKYVADVATIPTDEYQLRTRWQFLPAGQEVESTVLNGADVPGVLYVIAGEMISGGFTPAGQGAQAREGGVTSYFIRDLLLSATERVSAESQAGAIGARGSTGPEGALQFYAETQTPTQDGEGGYGGALGAMQSREAGTVIYWIDS